MKKDPLIFLEHILESINLIETYLQECDQKTFKHSAQIQDCCIRRLEIIGEAVKNLPMDIRSKNSDIPWKKIAGMRDILIHQYFGVDLEMTWKVVTHELPRIKKKILLLKSNLEKINLSI